MKAFWWFEENAIAGMARPGFNTTHWFDLPFDEAVLVGWLGQFPSGSASMNAFQEHLRTYAPKILKFYKLDSDSAGQATQMLRERTGLSKILRRVADKSQLLESFDVTDDQIHFEFSKKRLHWEIEYLKKQDIKKIASLTESHHNKDVLQEHFELYHFPITDLEAPKMEQVHQVAELIRAAKANREKLAVHCLAGIGRTSTMLIAAHLAMGEKLEDLKAQIARQNPVFVLTGSQGAFVQAISERFAE
jgi:protein-tyrosine phosphatase